MSAPLVDLRDEAARTHLLDDARQRDTRRLEKVFQESMGKESQPVFTVVIFGLLLWVGALTIVLGGPNLLTWLDLALALAFVSYRVLSGVGNRREGRELVGRLGQDYFIPPEPNPSIAPLRTPSDDARPSALLSAPERLHVRGKVRARTIYHAPLSGAACVAFRLVGSSGAFSVDDAGGTTFDVLVEGEGEGEDQPVAVESAHAVVALPTPMPRKLRADER